MKALSVIAFAGAAFTFYLLQSARTSPIGMVMVEIDTSIGFPPYVLLAVCGVAFAFMSRPRRQKLGPPPPSRPSSISSSGRSPAPPANAGVTGADDSGDWYERARGSARTIQWPSGTRLLLDATKPCPIELHLEQAPPERAKRAVSLLGTWIATIPMPPRARIVYENCPSGGPPRHHQVSGALAQSILRSEFKALSDVDAVDVLFFHADPRWSALR